MIIALYGQNEQKETLTPHLEDVAVPQEVGPHELNPVVLRRVEVRERRH